MEDVYRDYAAALERSVDELTGDEKKQAMLNHVFGGGTLEGSGIFCHVIEYNRRFSELLREALAGQL